MSAPIIQSINEPQKPTLTDKEIQKLYESQYLTNTQTNQEEPVVVVTKPTYNSYTWITIFIVVAIILFIVFIILLAFVGSSKSYFASSSYASSVTVEETVNGKKVTTVYGDNNSGSRIGWLIFWVIIILFLFGTPTYCYYR